MGIYCPADRRDEVSFVAAQALRDAFPQYTGSPKAWRDKQWYEADVLKIITIVEDAVRAALARRTTFEPAPQDVPNTPIHSGKTEEDGFVRWRLFRWREPVSFSPGVYLLAYFDGAPAEIAEPSSNEVIYIGLADGQSTGTRLQQFEQTALFGTGHIAGFTYRTEFVPEVFDNNFELLKRFHNTYCSWIDLAPRRDELPRQLEARLLREYRAKWGRLPRLNKQG